MSEPSFEENQEKLEKLLELLESGNLTDEEMDKTINEAQTIKENMKKQLAEQKAKIKQIADNANISMEELGLD